MSAETAVCDVVIGISPCGEIAPSPRVAQAVGRGGGLGVVDLGAGRRRALAALELSASRSGPAVGVRLTPGCRVSLDDLESVGGNRIGVLLLAPDAPVSIPEAAARYRVLAEVISRAEAIAAVRAGAHGLIARGAESGGRAGALSSFVLLQRLLGDEEVDLPIWAAGGIGPRTAVGSVIGGAAGVVLDTQLGLMPESDLPDAVRAVLRRPDIARFGRPDAAQPGRPGDWTSAVSGGGCVGADHLRVPGEDRWLAAEFTRRWRDTEAAVRGIRSAILEAVVRGLPDADADVAASLGILIPVAQGPMVGVSDRPGLAAAVAAVAAEGGLPLVALAFADAERSRRLLREVAAAVPHRPWGVGVLGSAPEDVRAAQLEAILATRPHFAVIAGGRPAQARQLEQAGIAAFPHASSPESLRQFLHAGVRRFVFEGSEPAGHPGPRTSFSLWESQLAVLERFLDGRPDPGGEQIQVFFAGGVHDARSVAMVRAMAGTLTARGVGVGILVGTPYLHREVTEHARQFHTQRLDDLLHRFVSRKIHTILEFSGDKSRELA